MKRLLSLFLVLISLQGMAQVLGRDGYYYIGNPYNNNAKDIVWSPNMPKALGIMVKSDTLFKVQYGTYHSLTSKWVFRNNILYIDTSHSSISFTNYWTKTKSGDTIYPNGNYNVKLNYKFYLTGIPYVSTGSMLFYNSSTKQVTYGTNPATYETSSVAGCKFLGSSSTDTLISSSPPIFRRLVKKDLPRNMFYWTTTQNITAGWKSAGDTLGYNFGGLGGGGDTCLWKIVAGHLETKGFDSVWVNHLRINSPTPNLITNPIFAVNGSVQIFDDINRWALIDLSPDYTKSLFADTTGIILNVAPFQFFGFGANGLFSPPGNGYLGDAALGQQWDKLYTTNITDDSVNVLLKVPVNPRDTILVTENDTISKMAIADLPVGDSSLFYDDSGSIRNKPTADVHIDTAFTLTGLRSMIGSYNNQFVLIVDTTNGNVYRTKLRNFIDTLIIAGMDSSFFWLYNDTVKIKSDYKFYLTDSVYFNRYAIPTLTPGEPVGSPLVMRKLNATSIGQLAYTTWQNYGDSLFTNFDTLSHYQTLSDFAKINRQGFVNSDSVHVSFNETSHIVTLTPVHSRWQYFRAGYLYTVTGSKAIDLDTIPTGFADGETYYIFIDNNTGYLTASETPWTLLDDNIPVAYVQWNSTLYPKSHFAEELHTSLIDRKIHYYLHTTRGTQWATGGIPADYVLNSATSNDNNTFSLSEALVLDEDLIDTVHILTDPAGTNGEGAYITFYHTGASTWSWDTSDLPYKFASGSYIQYDNGSGVTTGQHNKWYNTYVFLTNFDGRASISIISGRSEFASATDAYSENPNSFTYTGFPINEAVAAWQFTWHTNVSYSTKGKCVLVRNPQRINTTITTIVVPTPYEIDPEFKSHGRDTVLAVMQGLYLVDPTPDSDSTANGQGAIFTAGETVAFGDLCYMDATGKLQKCDADSNIWIPGEYVCITKAGVTINNTGTFLIDGFVRCDARWTFTTGGQNGMVYASVTAGAMSQTAPVGSLDWVQAVGTASGVHTIHFRPDKLIFQLN